MSNLLKKEKALKSELKRIQSELAHIAEVKSGDRPAPEIERLIKSQSFSYGVRFTRSKALKRSPRPGIAFTSVRRFATRKEAEQHAKRFARKHGHKKAEIMRVNKRANAWVNWLTGKTNPVLNG